MRIFCIFSAIIVAIVFPCLCADSYFENGFLDTFMKEQSISIMGNILAIYIAVASAFIVIIGEIEEKTKNNCNNTLKELKTSIVFMIILYSAHILLMIITPTSPLYIINLILKGAKIFTFSLYIVLLYELTNVLFIANSFKNKKE